MRGSWVAMEEGAAHCKPPTASPASPQAGVALQSHAHALQCPGREQSRPAIPHAHNWTGSVLVFPSSYCDWKREPPSLTLGVTQLREPSSAVPLSRPSCRLPWTPLNPFGTMIKLHSQKITLHREKALWQAYAFFSPFRIK